MSLAHPDFVEPQFEHVLSMPEAHPEGGVRVVTYFSPTGASMEDLLSTE
jgi:hypothetical protein